MSRNYNSVAYINGKGGCGKSTSIYHSAGVLAKRGKKTLVIDFDKQGNSTKTLLMENKEEIKFTAFDYITGACEAREAVKKAYFCSRKNAYPKYYGVDVMPADKRFKDETLLNLDTINVKEDFKKFVEEEGYEWVLVDMPPDKMKLNTICFQQIVDNVIVPFSSDFYSVDGYEDLMDTVNSARAVNVDLKILGIFLSRYMENCAVDISIKETLEVFGDMFLDVQIPLMADLREAIMWGRPMSFYKVFSKSKAAYERLVDIMEQRIEELR